MDDLEENLITPLLMVAPDLNSNEIRSIFKMFKRWKETKAVQKFIYYDEDVKENFRPKLFWTSDMKTEL